MTTDQPDQPRYYVNQDNTGRWFLTPLARADEWVEFCEIQELDERLMESPDFAEPIVGGPEFLTFVDPVFNY